LLWDLTVENLQTTVPGAPCVLAALTALELELTTLDRLGARIAAAHLDAAIQQLRLDQARRAARPQLMNYTI
jgi:hypothetical protein